MLMDYFPEDQVLWYLDQIPHKKLEENLKTEVLIIGGGMAGLSAAQAFNDKGCSVVLIEKNFCGSGASGKSSGFITADAELGLPFFVKHFGADSAKEIWNLIIGGVNLIRDNIKNFSISCDYKDEDILVLASSQKGFDELKKNHATYQQLSYKSALYTKKELKQYITSHNYYGAFRYFDTFGIRAFAYCQAMKQALQKRGVEIYEDTPALTIKKNRVKTPSGEITADKIIVCSDRYLPELGTLKQEVFAAQTFLLVSEPLSDDEVKKIFPHHKFMAWDTDFIYQYFRLIDNNRFLIGGSTYMSAFWGKAQHDHKGVYKKLTQYVKKKFPQIAIHFNYMWPGLIGISKDTMPVTGFDQENPNIYYISGCGGLSIAAALGYHSAEVVLEKKVNAADHYFSYTRKFPIGNALGKILGKRITFSLSNLISMK